MAFLHCICSELGFFWLLCLLFLPFGRTFQTILEELKSTLISLFGQSQVADEFALHAHQKHIKHLLLIHMSSLEEFLIREVNLCFVRFQLIRISIDSLRLENSAYLKCGPCSCHCGSTRWFIPVPI